MVWLVVWLDGLPTVYNREVIASEGTPSILCHPSIMCPAGALASLSAPSSLRPQTTASSADAMMRPLYYEPSLLFVLH